VAHVIFQFQIGKPHSLVEELIPFKIFLSVVSHTVIKGKKLSTRVVPENRHQWKRFCHGISGCDLFDNAMHSRV
jgi:hypothetical protein